MLLLFDYWNFTLEIDGAQAHIRIHRSNDVSIVCSDLSYIDDVGVLVFDTSSNICSAIANVACVASLFSFAS